MEPLAWDAKKKHGKSLRSGGCAGCSRANAEGGQRPPVVPKRTLRSWRRRAKTARSARRHPQRSWGARRSILAPALAPRPGTRMRTLPELVGRLA